ncbi:hypothetical protein KR51_00001770 [Rubidibacter lacunae KORDI 51-2]|uniref:Uncharacterized protein n=1 Tax=Rubidibacter lacunae KORDI 51-2 TaxID=582515 RepID=U5DR84_9CHRO|nr:hypothetical protein KR51_00001770 [Rubidibacter lacunae KORDI 51-2]
MVTGVVGSASAPGNKLTAKEATRSDAALDLTRFRTRAGSISNQGRQLTWVRQNRAVTGKKFYGRKRHLLVNFLDSALIAMVNAGNQADLTTARQMV